MNSKICQPQDHQNYAEPKKKRKMKILLFVWTVCVFVSQVSSFDLPVSSSRTSAPLPYETRFIDQPIDHNNPVSPMFSHRYLYSDEHWGKGQANYRLNHSECPGPILVYTGNEGALINYFVLLLWFLKCFGINCVFVCFFMKVMSQVSGQATVGWPTFSLPSLAAFCCFPRKGFHVFQLYRVDIFLFKKTIIMKVLREESAFRQPIMDASKRCVPQHNASDTRFRQIDYRCKTKEPPSRKLPCFGFRGFLWRHFDRWKVFCYNEWKDHFK